MSIFLSGGWVDFGGLGCVGFQFVFLGVVLVLGVFPCGSCSPRHRAHGIRIFKRTTLGEPLGSISKKDYRVSWLPTVVRFVPGSRGGSHKESSSFPNPSCEIFMSLQISSSDEIFRDVKISQLGIEDGDFFVCESPCPGMFLPVPSGLAETMRDMLAAKFWDRSFDDWQRIWQPVELCFCQFLNKK